MSKASKIGLIVLAVGGIALYMNRQPVKRMLSKSYRSILPNEKAISNEKNLTWGIDLSHHQKLIDWDVLVKKNKPDFIFFKATEGSSHVDTKFSEYRVKSKELGIPSGAYHFFSYQSSGISQAEHFIEIAKLNKGDLYPVLDVEYKKSMKSKGWIINEIKSYCQAIKRKYGVWRIIYCECDFYNNYLKGDFKEYNYWISDLYREPKCGYVIWQYTDHGFVHGIGKIDNNRLNISKIINNFKL